jgi:hypothetical protein
MTDLENTTGAAGKPTVTRAVLARLQGPGGYYNIGNPLGLVSGTAVQLIRAAEQGPIDATQCVRVTLEQFIASPSAVALSLAMLVFFWSGEIYHRAWSRGLTPFHSATGGGKLPWCRRCGYGCHAGCPRWLGKLGRPRRRL